jgi:probable HAF family extracellular repeat protein
MHKSTLRLSWALLGSCLCAAAAHAVSYRVTDLGALASNHAGLAGDLNDLGHVTGTSGPPMSTAWRATLWQGRDGLLDLGVAPGFASSYAGAVNNAGQAVGTNRADAGVAYDRAFRWSAAGGMQLLPPLPGGDTATSAFDINDTGMVAGSSYRVVDFGSYEQAVVWNAAGVPTSLGPGEAYAINDLGQAVGVAPDGWRQVGFLWDPVQGISILPIPDASIFISDINNRGQVIGMTTKPSSDGNYHAFVWSALGGVQSFGEGWSPLPLAINEHGAVVGSAWLVGGTRAFLWTAADGMQDLNGMLDEAEGTWLYEAVGINEAGQIAATALVDGQQHGVLLTPVPEPAALALFVIGLVAGPLALRRQAGAMFPRRARDRPGS